MFSRKIMCIFATQNFKNNTTMTTFTITINERTAFGKGLISHLSTLPQIRFEKVVEEKQEYDPEFVKKIRKGEKDLAEGKGKAVKVEDLWK